MNNYDLAIASDHSGFELKEKIIKLLTSKNLKVLDLGTNSTESVDYPDFAYKVTREIIEKTTLKGILICKTGIGMSIAANRSSEIRAALCTSEEMAENARSHNNANILVLGCKLVDDKVSFKIVEKFLNTKFEGARHLRRLAKIR